MHRIVILAACLAMCSSYVYMETMRSMQADMADARAYRDVIVLAKAIAPNGRL